MAPIISILSILAISHTLMDPAASKYSPPRRMQNAIQTPTPAPTKRPTSPTGPPPTFPPITQQPTAPTGSPTTKFPTADPTTPRPTTKYPTRRPTPRPVTQQPTLRPTFRPTDAGETGHPTVSPTLAPTPITCDFPGNFFYNGNAAQVSGQTHFQLWNGNEHSFMAVPKTNDPPTVEYINQYYYITYRGGEGFTTANLPYSVIGKHKPDGQNQDNGNPPLRGKLDYLVMELFDTNDDVYLLILYKGAGSAEDYKLYTQLPFDGTAADKWPTLKGDIEAARTLSEFSLGTAVPLGSIFTVLVALGKNDNEWVVTVTVADPATGGDCVFKMTMSKPSIIFALPQCYQCFIAGLLGDFVTLDNDQANPPASSRMATCDGGRQTIVKGFSSTGPEVGTMYSNVALTWLSAALGNGADQVCPRGPNHPANPALRRRRLQSGGFAPPAGPCEITTSQMYQLAVEFCDKWYSPYAGACRSVAAVGRCQSAVEKCPGDTCFASLGNPSRVEPEAQAYMEATLGQATDPAVQEESAPDDLEVVTSNPTTSPTPSPTTTTTSSTTTTTTAAPTTTTTTTTAPTTTTTTTTTTAAPTGVQQTGDGDDDDDDDDSASRGSGSASSDEDEFAALLAESRGLDEDGNDEVIGSDGAKEVNFSVSLGGSTMWHLFALLCLNVFACIVCVFCGTDRIKKKEVLVEV